MIVEPNPPSDIVKGDASSAGATRTTRRRRKEARPEELTAAALELFVERGFAATRLDDVAKRAGVSKGTLYLYFDSKEALFKAVIQDGVLPVLEAGEALLDQYPDDPRQLLHCILYGWWSLIGNTRLGGIAKLMLAEARNFPELALYYHDAVIKRGLALIRTAVKRGIDQKVFRAIDVDTVAPVLLAPLMHLALWQNSIGSCCGQTIDADVYLATHFELVMNGLGMPAHSSGATR